MADLFLYRNLLQHARALDRLQYRRRSAALRNQEVAFEMPEDEFVGLYRLTKPLVLDLIHEIEPYLPGSGRGGLTVVSKVLSALAFYATGSYQRIIGGSVHNKMHQVSVSNCVRAVSVALNAPHFRQKYIKFPLTREERNLIIQGFYNKFGMPGVVGCVDGTHIAIVRPAANVPDAHLSPEEEQNEISLQTREIHRDVEPQSLAAGERTRNNLIDRIWAART